MTPLILLPGLGADGRMFSSIRADLPQVITPGWIAPRRGESVAEYARRYAPVIDPGRPCFIGGASFGGIMAQELALVLPQVRACFVIGSQRADTSRPWRIRLLRPITPLVRILPRMAPLLVRLLGTWLRPPTRGVLTQLAEADGRFLSWGAGAILTWRPSQELNNLRILQIHGDSDRVFPVPPAGVDLVVPGAGHLISITHPQAVAEFLRRQMELIESMNG